MNGVVAAQESSGSVVVGAIVAGAVGLALIVFLIAVMWKVFTKAGKPGWAAIIPFYNTYVLIKIAGRPGWWLVLFFIPIAQIVVSVIVMIEIAKSFGKSGGFGVLLFFLPFIGFPILAFGAATYLGPVADPNFAGGHQARYGQAPAYPQAPGYPPQQSQQPYPPQGQPPYPPQGGQPPYPPQGGQPPYGQ